MNSSYTPPEIWGLILRKATSAPGLLETSCLPPLSNAPRSWTTLMGYSSENSPLRRHLQTKMSVVRVCRLWKTLGYEFLYEYIDIDRSEQLRCVVETLEYYANLARREGGDVLGGHTQPQHYIKRVEFRFGRFFSDLETDMDLSKRLFLLCDDIRIFLTMDSNRPLVTPRPIVRIPEVVNQAKSLCHCFIIWDHLVDAGQAFLTALEQYGLLEVLQLFFAAAVEPFPVCHISLPRLHSLRLIGSGFREATHNVLDSIALWELPALQRVTFTLVGTEGSPGFTSFFSAHGKTITTLELMIVHVTDFIHTITSICPNLEVLTTTTRELLRTPPSLPTLRQITLYQVTSFDMTNQALEKLFAAKRPKLSIIRLRMLDSWSRREILQNHSKEWIVWDERWSREGVHLEDWNCVNLRETLEGRNNVGNIGLG